MNWRRSEFISLSTLVIVASWIWWASAKANAWDANEQEVKALRAEVDQHGQQLAVLVDAVKEMRDDLKYLRRHTH